MLDDRDYMRPGYDPDGSYNLKWPLSYWLIGSLIVAFALQAINVVYFHFPLYDYFALSLEGLQHGYVWQVVTFQFLHANFFHLFFNILGLVFFARPVEERLGKAHFLKLYFLSGIIGGLLQSLLMFLFPHHFSGMVVGASAGIFGLLTAFLLLNPQAVILLFFVVPVSARYLLYAELAISLFFTLVPADGVAHAAHLGGIFFAIAYVRWGLNFSESLAALNPFQKKFHRERMLRAATTRPSFPKLKRANSAEAEEVPPGEFISSQVDPILDKISAQGIQSLTEKERQILQAARSRMSRR